jgi:hypothetical protein
MSALGTPGGDLGGASFSAALVTGLQGIPISNTTPTPGSALVFTSGTYVPTQISPGINQTTGAVLCGPGSGTQPCTIPAASIDNTKLAAASPQSLKCNAGTGLASPTDCSVSGGLAFSGGALQLAATGVVGQQITVGSNCWAIGADGRITGIAAGACNSGAGITADDGVTALTADDGVTAITADGGGGAVACTAVAYKFNIKCNAVLFAWRPM